MSRMQSKNVRVDDCDVIARHFVRDPEARDMKVQRTIGFGAAARWLDLDLTRSFVRSREPAAHRRHAVLPSDHRSAIAEVMQSREEHMSRRVITER